MTGASATHLVAVALPMPVHRTFTYRVEGPRPELGTRVLVPFRRGERIGWVVGHDAERVKGIRSVLDVLEETPSVSPGILRLARWMADYYVAPLGIVLRSALPAVLTDTSRDYLQLAEDARTADEAEGAAGVAADATEGAAADVGSAAADLTPRERRLVEALGEREGPTRVQTLRRELSMGSIWPEVRSLVASGRIRHEAVPPQPPSVRTQRVVRLVDRLQNLKERDDIFGRAYRQREAFELLESSGGSAELAHLTGQHGFSRSVVTGLEEKGLVEVVDEEVMRDPFEGAPPEPPVDHVLTAKQEEAVAALVAGLDETAPTPVLLHGVTGSGKTRVYVELLKGVVERGRGAIVLVPEISLTPQTVARFRAWFGDRVAVLHSALSDGERYDAWRQLRRGEKTIAVGARSALFAPIPELGAIVVDEEHDGSYKQSEAPRYHGRDLAVVRASFEDAVCCLGSATPSLESWSNVESGKFARVSLPERVGGGRLPTVEVIDLRKGRRDGGPPTSDGSGGVPDASGGSSGTGPTGRGGTAAGGGRESRILTPPLVEAVQTRLDREEQVIILLNRRGYSSFVQCRECGDVRECAHCSVSLTYHRVSGRVVCHHCRYQEPAPERCHRCGSRDLSFRGLGTEQVERVVTETFGGARVARMDVDTTSGKWSHHEILGRVRRGEVDILLGTQMIAKGLDFPRVTLVGVVNADVGLHLPDFRASERTFQLLSQVAGRAGRGELGGEVLVQTSVPEHYAIQAALHHDYAGFAERELSERASPEYPPHVRLVNVVLSSPDQGLAAEGAEAAVHWILRWQRREGSSPVELVGPAPAPIERLHGRWRWHFLLRSRSVRGLGVLCHAFMHGFRPQGRDVRVALDRDPTALL